MKKFAVYVMDSRKTFIGFVFAEDYIDALQRAKWDFSYDFPEINFDRDITTEEEKC